MKTAVLTTCPCFSPITQIFQAGKKSEAIPTICLLMSMFPGQNSDNQFLRFLQQTNPEPDKKRIEQNKGGLVTDAHRWVFDNDEFQQWRNNEDGQLLWITGNVGTGKTMLLAAIINEMLPKKEQPDESDCQVVVTYFFCQRDDKRINNATAVLGGLIYLLAIQQEELIKHLKDRHDDPFKDANPVFTLSKILEDMLGDIKATVYLIIDALDECDETGLEQLLDEMISIASEHKNVRWLVSSRNNSLIKEQLKSEDRTGRIQLDLNTKNISLAVDIYINDKLSKLEWLKHDTELRDKVHHTIHKKANATFLWVSLVCDELQAEDGSSVLRVLKDAPKELGLMQQRSRVCVLLKQGYKTFKDFKTGERKDYSLLRDAIAKYNDAIKEAKKRREPYLTGILRAYISLAECHRELSHSYKLSQSDKMKHVKTAEEMIQSALELAKNTGDERREQRALFDEAVLRARTVLVEMKQPNQNLAAHADLRAKLRIARDRLMTVREQYETAENRTFVDWANTWLKRLDEAVWDLQEK